MNYGIQRALEKLREFQNTFIESHVGGSIGLMIRGIDLKRDLNKSDLDITNPYSLQMEAIKDCSESSSPSDFDHSLRLYMTSDPHSSYVKMEVRINPEPQSELIDFEGYTYRVSMLKDILFWKDKYAKKGVQKHINDLIVINGGERPITQTPSINNDPFDDLLPF